LRREQRTNKTPASTINSPASTIVTTSYGVPVNASSLSRDSGDAGTSDATFTVVAGEPTTGFGWVVVVDGNDDGGTLGAWYVLTALGVYPVPGSDRWLLVAPRFPQARVLLGGRELVITAEGVSDEAMYVQRIELDGVVVDGGPLTHAQLAGAQTLHFVMAALVP
jgi:putative alpha-1,2-mannosidase